ncbi:hypothetical protein L1987_02051 [Smallanthus sonchifolius]|uniref:Uncharacterized protein n=1 Tax=Smallanthus sonchifolius TaxID=185202 RepID=A0ACB9K6R3_9ASTR|nr:hypothetical protein L1987_02051 [Smallanthus sonchifolius]
MKTLDDIKGLEKWEDVFKGISDEKLEEEEEVEKTEDEGNDEEGDDEGADAGGDGGNDEGGADGGKGNEGDKSDIEWTEYDEDDSLSEANLEETP